MNNLSTIIKLYVGSEVDFDKDVFLQDDGQGPYIKTWNINTKTKPTQEQLNALKTEAQTIVDSNQVIANRKAEYPSIEELVVALYDTEDKLAIENKRKAIKEKYPK